MIYADENVWIPVAEGLRRRGWDVTTALEEGTLGYSDEEHLAYAFEREWPLLTFDDDFLSLVQSGRTTLDHTGILFIAQHGRDVGELVRRIDRTLSVHDGSDLHGQVVFC